MVLGRQRLMMALAGALLWLAVPAPGARAQVTAERLEQRVNELVAQVRGAQRGDGSFAGERNRGWSVGQTALGVLALRAAGVDADDPAIRRAVKFLLDNEGEGERGVYEVSLRVMALESVDRAAYRAQIASGARYLMRAQQGSGGWSYRESGRTDNSNSQFAILGLNSAALSGVEVPQAVWESARSYFAAGQNGDGGWGYMARAGNSYGSMTAAGVASLYVCDLWLHAGRGRCGVYPEQRRVEAGLGWLAQKFSVTRNPGHNMWKFYYLYGLERAGVILAQRYFGRHDWYREGVNHLVGDPARLVSVPGKYEWPFLQWCFSLLFLAKGNSPILMHKARWAGGWNTHRYDARFLVQFIGGELEQPLDWQILPLEAPLDQLMRAPILYVSGKGPFVLTPDQLRRLKEFTEAGGFVLMEAANGDGRFDQSARAVLRRQFPEDELEALPPDHPLYTAYFELEPDERPRLEAIKGPCWISALYAPEGLSCEWDVADFEHRNFRLGVNVAAYVTGLQRLEGKLVEPVYYVPSDREPARRRGAFTLGQVVHAGEWRPHKVAWSKVLEQVNERAGLAVYSRPLPIRLDAESPFQAHMLYLTGVRGVTLDAEAQRKLRLYLERGGVLFAEAACGSARFDESFRRLMEEMLPGRKLRRVPVGHPLLEFGEPLGEVAYSPAVQQADPRLRGPHLEYIEEDGRAVVIYSKYDISSAIDGHPCFTCPSVLEPSASRLALKIVLYGLSS
jgi:hypothetical protein